MNFFVLKKYTNIVLILSGVFFAASLFFAESALAASPVISSITPASGPTAGGTNVTISGTNFIPSNTGGDSGWVTVAGKTLPGVFYGSQQAVVGDMIYLFGGSNGSAATSIIYSASVSDPTTWTNTGKTLPGNLYYSQLAVIGSDLYLFGGYNGTAATNVIYTASVSDPTTWTVVVGKTLPGNLYSSQIAVLNDKLYLFGGQNGTAATNVIYTASVSDPTTWTVVAGKTLPGNLYSSQVIVLNDKLYLFGGYGAAATNVIYTASVSDPTTWTVAGKTLPAVLSYSQLIAIGDYIYLFGGFTGTASVNSIYRASVSDPITWSSVGTLSAALRVSSVATIGDFIYLFGGYTTSSTNAIYSAPIQHFRPNVFNKSWLTNWGTITQDQSNVTIGGNVATNINFSNSTTITATTSAHTAGATDVVVTNYDGQSDTLTDGFTYNVAPTIDSILPTNAYRAGGDSITITGTGFYGNLNVTLGGTNATNVTVQNSTMITATTPAHTAGVVDVSVTNEDGQSVTLSNGFTFNEFPPIVSSITPSSGPVTGGTNVTIAGNNFISGDFGSGVDGTITISANKNLNTDSIATGRTCADAINYSVTALTANTATLSTTPAAGCLAIGDEILLINLQGTSSNYGNVGNYETLKIQSISSNVITFATNKAKYYGDSTNDDSNIGTASTNQRVMLQRVPNYQDVTINSGYTLTTNAWDGALGGVLYFKANGMVTNNGTIDMSGKGYRGGSGGFYNTGGGTTATSNYLFGYQGESFKGLGIQSNNASLQPNDGGSGGGGYKSATTGGCGGGGASYGTAGTKGAEQASGCGGLPGNTYGSSTLDLIFLGSGAGGGGGNSTTGAKGGTGGGIIAIHANNINTAGNINSNGSNASGGSSGGGASGGSGGSVYLLGSSVTIGTSKVNAAAGAKRCLATCGGNSGNGIIAINYSTSISGTANPLASETQKSNYSQPLVLFGGVSASNVNVLSPTTITATTPTHTAGATDVTITSYDGQFDTLENAFDYHSWITSGTYTSTVKALANNSFGTINWVASTPTNSNIAFKIKSCTTADCSDKPSWIGCELSESDNNTDVSGKGCIEDGQGYVQYQAYLSTDSVNVQPYLDSVTISTQPVYSRTFLNLISSPFDTGSEYSSVQKVSWTAANDTTQGTVGVQIRTAPDNGGNPDWTNSVWCGPSDCSQTANSASDFAASYYTDKSGATAINSANSGTSNNQWIQYATFLKSADGTATPTLSDISLQYSYNVPPEISSVSFTQNPDGSVSVPYSLSETYDDNGNISHGTSSAPIKALLFYQPDDGITVPALTNSQTGTVILNNPNNAPIPTQGIMMIDNELIEFDGGNGNTINILATEGSGNAGSGRGAKYDGVGGNFYTTAVSHSENTPVYFKANKKTDGTALAHTISSLNPTGIVGSVATVNNTFEWDPRNDPYLNLNSKKITNLNFRVAANDADSLGVNNIGAGSVSSQALDLESPTIASVTTTTDSGAYQAGVTIPLSVNFSEIVNFDSAGGKTITLTLNSGTCTIASDIINSSSAICNYVIGSNEVTPSGQYLSVNSISSNGEIKDIFSNQENDFTFAQNIDQNNTKQITIDTSLPYADDLDDEITREEFTRSLSNVSDGSGSGIASYFWSKVSGPGDINFGSENSDSTTISANTDGSYVLSVAITDNAGNQMIKTMNLIWDTVDPADPGKPNVDSITNDNTPIISWDKSVDTDGSGLEKYELQRKTGTDGNFATIATITDNASLTADTPSYTESILADGIYFYQVIATDRAGNASTGLISSEMVVDTIKPTLLSFTSNKSDVTPQTAYGKGEVIDVRAVYSESLALGSTITVQLENSANPPVNIVLDNIENTSGQGILYGSFVVDGPRKGYDTLDLGIRSIVSENAIDLADNNRTDSVIPVNQNLSDNKNIAIDTGTPILLSFSAKKLPSITSGSFKAGDQLQITATYSKPIASGSITVHFNTENGSEDNEDIVLDTVSGAMIYGTYTVQSGDNTENLNVLNITSQDVTDFKGNVLSNTGTISDYDAYFQALPGENIAAVQNISDIEIDTTSPELNGPAISYDVAKTNSQTPIATLAATDNFDLSDGTMQFSLNGGSSWCSAVSFAASYAFDITNSSCGGSSANEIKTVTVKFIDKAGNISDTASTTIEYDNSKPVLEKISTEQNSGIYGPDDVVKIIAQYDEALAGSCELTVQLNNGKQISLNTIENGNQLTATYIVGATGSLEDVNKLRVASIVAQSVSDTVIPANIQDSTSLAGISENIDSNNKVIVIDTTAPTGSIVIDRSAASGQVQVNANDENNEDDMQAEIKILDSGVGSCVFTGAWVSYSDNMVTDLVENENSARKGCVRFKDKSGNISEDITTLTPETPSGIQLNDVSNSELTPPFYGAVLTWQKPANFGQNNEFAAYEEIRCKSSDGNNCVPDKDNPFTVDDPNLNYHISTNLDADTKYCYQVRFKDTHGNYSKLSQTLCNVFGQAPLVTDSDVDIVSDQDGDILITDIKESSAKIIFSTQDAAHDNVPVLTKAIIDVYSDPELTEHVATSVEESDYSVIHVIPITGLSGGTQYYLKITASDSSDISNPNRSDVLNYDSTDAPALMFSTIGTLKAIEDIKESVITETKAVISFTTDQDAKCFIDFKDSLSVEYNDLSENLEKDYSKNHAITLTQLIAKTPYDYKITCSDNENVVVVSSEHHFATLEKGLTQGEIDAQLDSYAPSISNVSLANVTGENATITWNTDESANSLVVYEVDGATYSMMAGDSEVNSDKTKFTTSHLVTINGLIPATKYLFTVMSYDGSGNIGSSSQTTFTTKQPSSLSSVKVVSKALGQATVTWSTNASTSSLVEYGPTSAYGQKKENSSQVKDHTVTLSDLTPGQTYHFRVRGEDAEKNMFVSTDTTFQPKAPPIISDFKIDSVFEHGATIRYTTNVPTDSLVTYNDAENSDNSGFQGKPEVAIKHEIKLKDLASGTKFSIKVKVRDEDGNETEEAFPDFSTTKDEVPPKIDRIKTDAALTQNDKVQAIISWTTNELATGQIVYKEGKTGEEKTFDVNTVPSFSHVGVITSFKSGVVYYFKVKSIDSSGNLAVSTDYALLTPKQQQNIIQIIINNFTDIFGWTKM